MTQYFLCFVLFCVGLYGMLAKRNLVKIILGLVVAEAAVNLLFVLVAYRTGAFAPIVEAGGGPTRMVDPLPHALVLTAIVIGLATTALMIAIAMRIYAHYGTYDIQEVRELKG